MYLLVGRGRHCLVFWLANRLYIAFKQCCAGLRCLKALSFTYLQIPCPTCWRVVMTEARDVLKRVICVTVQAEYELPQAWLQPPACDFICSAPTTACDVQRESNAGALSAIMPRLSQISGPSSSLFLCGCFVRTCDSTTTSPYTGGVNMKGMPPNFSTYCTILLMTSLSPLSLPKPLPGALHGD